MRQGRMRTQSEIQQLKGVDYGLQRTQRWKKEVEVKQQPIEKEVQDG